MITYASGSFGFLILFRFHGSAVFKALTPSVLSSCVYILLYQFTEIAHTGNGHQVISSAYTIGALVAALSFLLAFRANSSYNRWWESMTAVHHMHSKWLDVGMELAAFHLQSNRYNKPPAFGAHPELTCLVERERERLNATTLEELEVKLDKLQKKEQGTNSLRNLFLRKRPNATPPSSTDSVTNHDEHSAHPTDPPFVTSGAKSMPFTLSPKRSVTINVEKKRRKSINAPRTSSQVNKAFRFRFQKNPAPLAAVSNNALLKTVTDVDDYKAWDIDRPPLFLQETAHLLSLLSAVAFSTLRNDLEEADSPLISFTPGAPWPCVDPDDYGGDIRKDWDTSTHRSYTILRYLLGLTRTPKSRTLYNAARPFRVIGGVSDAEIEVLQAARGPLAKVALVTMWLQEFISREHLAGSTGAVAPPIIARLYQCISDGMMGYNQARKIAYIPFPFPHAQITSLFVLIVCGIMPVLMLSYLSNQLLGFALNLLTVMCFSGLHEVARELESPFQNVPNDVPLNNFQAQYNEALITMFFGCHPDSFWEVVDLEQPRKNGSNVGNNSQLFLDESMSSRIDEEDYSERSLSKYE